MVVLKTGHGRLHWEANMIKDLKGVKKVKMQISGERAILAGKPTIAKVLRQDVSDMLQEQHGY